MNNEQNAKIESAVREARKFGSGTDLPFTKLAVFIHGMRSNSKWNESEIIELQTRVSRELLSQRNWQEQTYLGQRE